jgi:putative copper resistance protein D
MVDHMTIAMYAPLFLVLAAPVSLALRALPARGDGSLGPRELLLGLVHSRLLRMLGNPIVAAVLFFTSLVVFYYSALFELALTTHTGHVLMTAHFLVTGYLFAWVMVGIDPGPPKWPPSLRLLILLITVSFHAFFGVALMSGTTLLAPDFFGALRIPWIPEPLGDQQTGGSIAWAVGEIPVLVLSLFVVRDWIRSDSRESRRHDRQADRDGDAELVAYNERLQELARRRERQRSPDA